MKKNSIVSLKRELLESSVYFSKVRSTDYLLFMPCMPGIELVFYQVSIRTCPSEHQCDLFPFYTKAFY